VTRPRAITTAALLLLVIPRAPLAADEMARGRGCEPWQRETVDACPRENALASGTGATRPRPEAACAAYDLHIMTLIEDLGLAEEADAQVLGDAALTMLAARIACRASDVKRALQLYDTIQLDHVRMSPLSRVRLR
jgi:hypothetical protein